MSFVFILLNLTLCPRALIVTFNAMKKIGLLSDTHGHLDEAVFSFFKEVDEIWHAGDIGNEKVLDELEAFKPLRAVYGNIDNHHIRRRLPEVQQFTVEQNNVYMVHIGGYPGKYAPGIKASLLKAKADLFICGHSHILKVIFDKTTNVLHVNPGAFGKSGFHQVRTMVRFVLDAGKVKELEVYESDRKG